MKPRGTSNLLHSASVTSFSSSQESKTNNEFPSSMHYMERPYSQPREKFPKHTVPVTSVGASGITFSAEVEGKVEEGRAELEVLKCILNREAYLTRLMKSVRTVNKKFKPEIADLVDFVRTATLDVVDAIVRWREAKNDHDAAFMWNGMNYVLKLSSDLDFMDSYRAIRNWMGFKLTRNPFVVPLPMEDGVEMFADRILDPHHTIERTATDGFFVGGISQTALRKKYAPSGYIPESEKNRSSKKSKKISPYEASKSEKISSNNSLSNASEGSSMDGIGLPLEKSISTSISGSANFVLNSDMSRIRQSEYVILKEEEKFGRFSRDPEGRIVPTLQAFTRHAALDLCKDDKRTMEEPSRTIKFAPHAMRCEVGVEDEAWVPDETVSNNLLDSQLLHKTDHSVDADKRGQSKIGGELAAITTKSDDSRIRKPLKIALESQAEFNRVRKKKTLADRLAEIGALREEITKAKLALLAEEEATNTGSGKSRKTPAASIKKRAESYDEAQSPEKTMKSMRQIKPLNKEVSIEEKLGSTTSSYLDENSGSTPIKKYEQPNDVDAAATMNMNNNASSASAKNGMARSTKRRAFVSTPQVDERLGSQKILEGNEEILERKAHLSSLENKLSELDIDEMKSRDELRKLTKDEETISLLKDQERLLDDRDRSREIERKRRLLNPDEGKRKGPPPSDPPNVYDYYAVKVQKIIRGFITRRYAMWLRKVSTQASIELQKMIRGWLGRLRVRRIRQIFKSAQSIQKVYRGWKARGTSAALVRQKNFVKSAVLVQRIWRGFLGKKRLASKRALDKAAKEAMASVDPRSCTVHDVRELGRRILNAVEEPSTPFPPDEVLHLIRITTIIIQGARGNLGLAQYDFINQRRFEDVDGEELSWFDASRILNRAERFLRIVRALAFGPGAKPPRLLQIPGIAHTLYSAQSKNHRWALSTFENMGMGSKFCCQLFRWLSSVVEVAARQQEFLTFIASSFPDWLPKLFELQSSLRKLEYDILINSRCIEVLEEQIARLEDDPMLSSYLEKEILVLRKENQENNIHLYQLRSQENTMKNDQTSRETFAKITLEEKYKETQLEYNKLAREYSAMNIKAAEGDKAAIASIGDLRVRLTNQKLVVNELEAQYKLLVLQCEKNEERRKDTAGLSIDTRSLSVSTGEGKALYLVAVNRTKMMLRSAGVKRPKDLPDHFVDIYRQLEKAEDEAKVEYRQRAFYAENARRAHDEALFADLQEMQDADCKSKDQMIPSDAELQEERIEDEKEAVIERNKKLQFVGDDVLKAPKTRPRPVVIALSRDLPASAKIKIHDEVTKYMPGVFITLDIDANMGLDVKAMQTILDAGKSIIMSVDPGLTRLTRQNFINNLEMCMKALIPNPFLAIAMGDETNKKFSSKQTHCGAHKHDIAVMRDGDLKASMESLQWVLDELSTPAMIKEMQAMSLEISPPINRFLIILEAFFLIQANETYYQSPEKVVSFASWRITHRLLSEPIKVINFIRSHKRGSAPLALLECLRQYILHAEWPKAYSTERVSYPLMHLLALAVEEWYQCDRLTQERGGLPSQVLSKSTLKGIQTVVYVTDSIDSQDSLTSIDKNSASGWRFGAARLIRTALQDLRIVKTVRKIDGVMFNICAYRENHMIYFDAYDPLTSQVYMTTVTIDNVPNLLYPNAISRELGGKEMEAPQTFEELYLRLIKLLKFEKFSTHAKARRVLYCKRDYTLLGRITTSISGHRVYLSSYEASLGELYFTAHVPEFSANITCLMALSDRLDLLGNATHTLEKDVFDREDTKLMLPFIADRLRIFPSRTSTIVRGIPELLIGRFQDRLLPPFLQRTQGLSLKIRHRGGIGKLLYQRVHKFSNVVHIVSIRRCQKDNSLRIMAYEPVQQVEIETTVTDFVRKMIFTCNTDAHRLWEKDLFDRLKLEWRGCHKLVFDSTLIRVVKKAAGRRLLLGVQLVDENVVEIVATDPFIGKSFTCTLTREQVVRILYFNPPIDTIQRDFGVRIPDENVRNILKNMTQRTTASASSSDVEKKDLDPMVLETPLSQCFATRDLQELFVSRLAFVMRRANATNIGEGYVINEPFSMKLTVAEDYSVIAKKGGNLDTGVRFTSQLKILPVTDDVAGVDRGRRQLPMINMEEELNQLAFRQSQEAMAKIEADLKATETIDEFIQEIGDEDDFQRAIKEATSSVTTELLDKITEKTVDRFVERNNPGTKQDEHIKSLAMFGSDGRSIVHVDRDLLTEEQQAILGRGESFIFEGGVKTTYREGKGRWYGHVSVKVFESMCWMGSDGVGRRLRFVVYEPSSSQYFEGFIRNSIHLREVLGINGQDMLDKQRAVEMVMFIAKYRLEVVKWSATWDGVDETQASTPLYKIEFQNDRLYDDTKVTPINMGGDDFANANQNKLVDLEKTRGKKLLRLVRRVSGILLQLTVFELPTPKSEDSMTATTPMNDTTDKANKTVPEYMVESGFAEERKRTGLAKYEAPTLRILGYDPRTKRKTVTVAIPEAILEVAGGVYSPYLDPSKRRDLSRVVCESLVLYFPKGKDFEVVVPWSGSHKTISNAVANSDSVASSWRSSAERIFKRNAGKLFRAGLKISQLECVVSLYSHTINRAMKEGDTEMPEPENAIIVNVYARSASEAQEILVSERDQVLRLGRPVVHFPEGAVRASAIRRFCRFIKAEILTDPDDENKKSLELSLLSPRMGFLTEYAQMTPGLSGDNHERPVGYPSVFMPLDTCGYSLSRRGMPLPNRDSNIKAKDYIVTVYTKSPKEHPERGLVIKMYERGSSYTAVLHVGPSELMRQCDQNNERDLIRDMIKAKEDADSEVLDDFEQEFEAVTEKGAKMHRYKKIVNCLVDIVLRDLAIWDTPDLKFIPYFKSKPYGIPPI